VRFNGLLNLTGLWFTSGKLSPTFKIIQMRKQTAKMKAVPTHCVLDDEEETGESGLVDDADIPQAQPAEEQHEVHVEVPEVAPEAPASEAKPKSRRLKGN
jgi:hypothetical protein